MEKKETDSGCVDKVQPSGLRDRLDVWDKGVEVVKKMVPRCHVWGAEWIVVALAKTGTQVYRQNS